MTKTSETVVFFGSGPVAAESLRLLAQNFTIEAVITKPRLAHHRGTVPVLSLAEELNLSTYTVSDKKSLDMLFADTPFKSRLGILIDFGIIISQKVIDYFPQGIINSHFSILPEWRGADPISFAILSGQNQTGVSLMMLVEAMDEGPLLCYGECAISPIITNLELTSELIGLSDALLVDTIPRHFANEISPFPQDSTGRSVSYSRKLTKQDGVIDWQKPAAQLEREIRALSIWPKSQTSLGGLTIIITKAKVMDLSGKPGEIHIHEKKLLICCGKQALQLESLKPAGKSEMTATAFLAGYRHLLNK